MLLQNIELPAKKADLPEVSMDKSTEGLAEVYEKEYMRRTLGVEEDDPQKPLKEELRTLFTKLCGKLDALCNFHFTPKPSVPDIAVQADVPVSVCWRVTLTASVCAELLCRFCSLV
jgi:U3 small nucleolar RNA-associated protein MPP10